MWSYAIDTSPESGYGLVLFATVLTAAVSAWAILESGWTPATAALSALTLVLAGASAYARFLGRRARRNSELRRVRAAKLRAFR